ncbi:type I-E CRISPR-associated protein Cas6/Cse3/CasE [Allosalinactinospora lopnorensis]|uniref:type I-E CRISPR-associated protein Cas6/Cse3/CasE n=1 Tax=Allosalinactinospora lopnorensis TaxID=1352348 RepID=UPI0006981B85|nr:type I-E CRISPR-associated protein Cas6/Cse3/CasE [Allosalinactinospora lopnorensis]
MTLPAQLWLTHTTLTGPQSEHLRYTASALHKKLMRMFPDGLGPQPRRQAGALYRVEPDDCALQLLVQSQIAPDLSAFPSARSRSLLPLFEHLTEGTPVYYRIAANPTKAVRDPENPKKRGTRKALYGDQANDWWRRKAHDAGLAPVTLDSSRYAFGSDVRRHGDNDRLLNHGIQFDGVAEVTDQQRLTSAIVEGIGRGRAYGLGLLSVVPARR